MDDPKENYPSMLLVKAERQGNQRQTLGQRNGSLIFSEAKGVQCGWSVETGQDWNGWSSGWEWT